MWTKQMKMAAAKQCLFEKDHVYRLLSDKCWVTLSMSPVMEGYFHVTVENYERMERYEALILKSRSAELYPFLDQCGCPRDNLVWFGYRLDRETGELLVLDPDKAQLIIPSTVVRRSKPRRFVYFVEAQEAKLIKIGIANDPAQRLITLQAASVDKLVIIGVIDGDQEVERNLHARFSHLRQHGEWFRPGDDLMDYILENAKDYETRSTTNDG